MVRGTQAHRGAKTLSLTTIGITTLSIRAIKMRHPVQHYEHCHYAESRYAECHYAPRHSAMPGIFAVATDATNAVSLGVWYWPMGGWI